jgi:deazaflavin-dependent oxidoreductase (nitroreductase family)
VNLALPTGVRIRLRGTPPARWYARSHQRIYRLTGGRLGGTLTVPGRARRPILLLTTTGRVSGQPRTTPLIFLADGDRYVVIAANAGHPRPPAWWRNLLAEPAAAVLVRRRRLDVRAREATGDERDRLWAAFAEVYPPLLAYQRATDRPLPVVVLEPA